MSENKILTHKMIAKEAAAMLVEESQFIKSINRSREKEFKGEINGYKVGNSVKVKVPPLPVVTDGRKFSHEDASLNAQESHVELEIDIEKQVDLQFTSVERTLHIEEFKERFLRPSVNSLATTIDALFFERAIKAVNNMTFIAQNEPHPLAPFGRAREMMLKALAPNPKRFAMLSSGFTNKIIDNSGTLFNPTAEIAKQYKEGYVGRARGFEFIESEHLFMFQNGSKVDGISVQGANQTGGVLTLGGVSNGDTIKAGSVFTIDGVHQIHPLTRLSYGVPMQFVVLEDVTAGGSSVDVKIYPEITPTMLNGAKQANATVENAPDNGAGVIFEGEANQLFEQALCYQANAFAAAFVPKKVLAGCEGHTFSTETMALRVMTFGDGVEDYEGTRIDVLCGFTAVRGNHAARVSRLVA